MVGFLSEDSVAWTVSGVEQKFSISAWGYVLWDSEACFLLSLLRLALIVRHNAAWQGLWM